MHNRSSWELEQTDVDGVYLNAPLTETIYMRQPKGYEVPRKEHLVCWLLHTLYSLKQAGREWYFHFCDAMLEPGFTCCQTEHVVFHRYKDKNILIVVVEVDDLTMVRNTQQTITAFKQQLSQKFKIKDLGDLQWLLGIEVKQDHATRMISFSQQAYINRYWRSSVYMMQSPCQAH